MNSRGLHDSVKMSSAFMWVGASYMKQAKKQLDLPCPEERKISLDKPNLMYSPESPDSIVKLSLDTQGQLTCHWSEPQSWWMKMQKLNQDQSEQTASFYSINQPNVKNFPLHPSDCRTHGICSSICTKLLGRQKQRGIHGANFRVCLRSVDEGSTKTPSSATTESWMATDLF